MAAHDMTQAILQDVNRQADDLRSKIVPPDVGQGDLKFFMDLAADLRKCVMLRDSLVVGLRLQFNGAFDNEVSDYNETGQYVLAIVEASLLSFEAVQARAQKAKSIGLPEEVASVLEDAEMKFFEARRDVEAMRRDFRQRWPWIDEPTISEAIEADRQGAKFRPAREVFDELRRRLHPKS